MDSYCIEALNPAQVQHMAALLHEMGYAAGLEGLYWLPLEPQELSALQQEHMQSCGPYAMALELTKNSLCLEFLVRARNSLCCDCIHPAPPEVEKSLRERLDALLLCASARCVAPNAANVSAPSGSAAPAS